MLPFNIAPLVAMKDDKCLLALASLCFVAVSLLLACIYVKLFFTEGGTSWCRECVGKRTDCTAVCLMVDFKASAVTFAPCGRYLSEMERHRKPFQHNN